MAAHAGCPPHGEPCSGLAGARAYQGETGHQPDDKGGSSIGWPLDHRHGAASPRSQDHHGNRQEGQGTPCSSRAAGDGVKGAAGDKVTGCEAHHEAKGEHAGQESAHGGLCRACETVLILSDNSEHPSRGRDTTGKDGAHFPAQAVGIAA